MPPETNGGSGTRKKLWSVVNLGLGHTNPTADYIIPFQNPVSNSQVGVSEYPVSQSVICQSPVSQFRVCEGEKVRFRWSRGPRAKRTTQGCFPAESFARMGSPPPDWTPRISAAVGEATRLY